MKGLISKMGKNLKGKELGKGITQRKDGTYQGRFTDRLGNRKTYYGKTLSEVKNKLDCALLEDKKNQHIKRDNVTLDEWFEECLALEKQGCRDSTIHTYRIQYATISKELGNIRLVDLNKNVVQLAFLHMKSDAQRTHCKALLVDILNIALDYELVARNVAINIKTKTSGETKKEKRILSDEELETLLKYSKENGSLLYPLFVIASETGMRMGEILGLCWDCVDFKNNAVEVKRTLITLPGNGETKYSLHPPKTEKGYRTIPMSKSLKLMLLEQRMWKNKVETNFKPKEGFEDLVFTSKTNQPLHPANIKGCINYLVDKMNREMPELNFEHFTPHALRHGFATKCIANGMSPKTLQTILGHSTIQITMDLYTHSKQDVIKKEMAMISEMA